jgi:maleylacetoacetate isomerase
MTPRPALTLYDYFRSSASYRVRIALHLKGLAFGQVGVHLLRDEQVAPAYLSLNPQGLVPTLRHGSLVLTQSMAILEYIDELHPQPPLLPGAIEARARTRQLALLIACDIHPLNNLRVLKYLARDPSFDDARKQAWICHWIAAGFDALEAELAAGAAGRFCVGDAPTLADCCLVPQVFNAQRFGIDIEHFPTVARIAAACSELDAFQRAHPGRQPDAG